MFQTNKKKKRARDVKHNNFPLSPISQQRVSFLRPCCVKSVNISDFRFRLSWVESFVFYCCCCSCSTRKMSEEKKSVDNLNRINQIDISKDLAKRKKKHESLLWCLFSLSLFIEITSVCFNYYIENRWPSIHT